MSDKILLNVLAIDDQDFEAETLRRQLITIPDFDVQFSHVEQPDEAIERLRAGEQPMPDIVFLDYHLGGVDTGLDVLQTICKLNIHIPIVMVTGRGSEIVAAEAIKCGAQDYIVKDTMTPTVLQKVTINAIDSVKLQSQMAAQEEELRSFVATASHDLRAPLRAVSRFAEEAQTECLGKVSDEVDAYHDSIVNGGHRMTRLLDSLVEFTKCGRSEELLESLDLNRVVEEAVCNLHAETKESNAMLEIDSLPIVVGHEESLIALFQNLIGNAIKYSGDNVPNVKIEATRDDESWTVVVCDNGIGIASEYLESVFAPFRRLHSHSEIEGSGIGLSTCKRIIEHHRGRIWVESEPGQGCTFYFTLQAGDDESSKLENEKLEVAHTSS